MEKLSDFRIMISRPAHLVYPPILTAQESEVRILPGDSSFPTWFGISKAINQIGSIATAEKNILTTASPKYARMISKRGS